MPSQGTQHNSPSRVSPSMSMIEKELLDDMYRAFNAREIETVLATLHPQVEWPNRWEGGELHGRAAVRDYWHRQWEATVQQVEPTGYSALSDGRIAVTAHQCVRDHVGNVLADGEVRHVYTFEHGQVRRMEIVG